MCEGLSGSTRSAATLYQRASLRISPDKSRNRKLSVSFRQMHSSGVKPNQSVFLAPSIKNIAKSVARGLAASCRIISAT